VWAFPMGEMPLRPAIICTIWRCLKCDHEWTAERPAAEPSSNDDLLGDQPSCLKCGDLTCTTLVGGTLAPPDSLLMLWRCLACGHEWTDEHTTGAPSSN
jgi:rubredoxin